MKTGQSRIDDSINYIVNHVQAPWSSKTIQDTLTNTNASVKSIGKELSLGSRPDAEDDPQYAGNTQRRHARRALMLCPRVFLSDLSAEALFGDVAAPTNLLPKDWKKQSLAYWGSRQEAEIVEGIKIYSVRKRTADELADEASTGLPQMANSYPFLTLNRAAGPFPIYTIPSCYASVIYWLFRCGMVSFRWYIRNSGAGNKTTLTQALGLNDHTVKKQIGKASKRFIDQDTLPQVSRGHIVHLYVDNYRWNGHWLVSNGDGTATGCNNDQEGGRVNNLYDVRCSLDAQFLNGYKDKRENQEGYEPGIADVINPLKIPAPM